MPLHQCHEQKQEWTGQEEGNARHHGHLFAREHRPQQGGRIAVELNKVIATLVGILSPRPSSAAMQEPVLSCLGGVERGHEALPTECAVWRHAEHWRDDHEYTKSAARHACPRLRAHQQAA